MNLDIIISVTQVLFWVNLLVFAGGFVYFVLERGNLSATHKGLGTTAAVLMVVGFFQYWTMREAVGLGGNATFPTAFRYLGWVVALPLLVTMIRKYLGLARHGVAHKLAIAAFVMITAGWLTEFHGQGWIGFAVMVLAWAFIAFTTHTELCGIAGNSKSKAVKDGFCSIKKFVVFGWALWPLGTLAYVLGSAKEVFLYRELAYNLMDLLLIVWFCHAMIVHVRDGK